MTRILLGIDTGGTFTDFVMLRDDALQVHKVLSTPAAPEQAILQGLEDLGLSGALASGNCQIVHGTTVATNATLEGKGARTAYVTNRGLGDVLRIGRQTRESLYDLTPPLRHSPIDAVPAVEVDARLAADGEVLVPLTDDAIANVIGQLETLAPEAVAINLLFSFLDDRHERALEAALPERFFVSRSSFVLPEYREYERGVATWLNAWLGPLMSRYLESLQHSVAPSTLSVMQSSGLSVSADLAARRAVNLLLSGPVGGLRAAQFVSEDERLMTFDMGGTSTDVALIDGALTLTGESRIAQFPVAVPMADIHTIGAGGGSIAYVDAGGVLHVGPESSGARPGPACYGLGGASPTVTDANLQLGRLRADAFLGGTMRLDAEAAARALDAVGAPLGLSTDELAEGIVRIANEHMTQALRAISIERGHDPREFTLVCFGGAGGLHVCALAEALDIPRAMLPNHAGVLSALGMLVTPPGRELSHTLAANVSSLQQDDFDVRFAQMIDGGLAELEAEGVPAGKVAITQSADCRYAGQSFALNVPWTDPDGIVTSFHAAHQLRYGHALDKPVEVLNLRVKLEGPKPEVALAGVPQEGSLLPAEAVLSGFPEPVPCYHRETLFAGATFRGPALLIEHHSTALIHAGWQARIDAIGNVMLHREPAPPDTPSAA